MGVIGGDYSKLEVNSLFFRSGEWTLRPFSTFRFFRGADAPTIITAADHPLPPIEKLSTGKLPDASYPQATVDSVDNFCKSLILLEFF